MNRTDLAEPAASLPRPDSGNGWHREIGNTPSAPGALLSPVSAGKKWWALAAVCPAVVAVGVDGTVLNVALPTLSAALLHSVRAAFVHAEGNVELVGT